MTKRKIKNETRQELLTNELGKGYLTTDSISTNVIHSAYGKIITYTLYASKQLYRIMFSDMAIEFKIKSTLIENQNVSYIEFDKI